MSETKAPAKYGFANDEVKVNPFNFGLNKKIFLVKYGYIINGGKDGAEGEALDILFNINGTEKGYRMFPFTHGYDKSNNKVEDPNAQEYIDALEDWNARVTHILHAFLDKDTIKAALSKEITSFKQYCEITTALLPNDFQKKELFGFLVYQWQPSKGQDRTYLELPRTMKYGRWICAAKPGDWKEVKVENPEDSERVAIKYVNPAGEELPFTRNGWFMNSKFAKQEKGASTEESSVTPPPSGTANANIAEATPPAPKKAAAW